MLSIITNVRTAFVFIDSKEESEHMMQAAESAGSPTFSNHNDVTKDDSIASTESKDNSDQAAEEKANPNEEKKQDMKKKKDEKKQVENRKGRQR